VATLRRWFSFLHDNWVGVILTMTLLLFAIFIFAFFRNGEYGAHYDLAACWSGVSAIAVAAATGYGKWWADSKYNTEQGKPPEGGC
jgi:ascorbate-specific PTS system EIIC-type component UlaA